MLSMEHYSSILLMILFACSMLGSIERSDINSTYSLFSYMFLASYRYRTSLNRILSMLILLTILILLSDVWAFSIMMIEPISVIGHIFGYSVLIV